MFAKNNKAGYSKASVVDNSYSAEKYNAILLKLPFCTLDDYIGQFMQLTVPTQSGNITGIVLVIAPLLGIVISIVRVQDNYFRFTVIGANESIKKFYTHTIQILAINGVLQMAHRWLGSKILSTLRQPSCTHFENHVIAQIITVVAVLISRCYLKYPLDKHLFDSMVSISLIPIICNTVAYAID